MATYFFDLDGTLTDSREGLFAAFRAGLAAIGARDLPDEALQRYLGTPLPQVLAAVEPAVTAADVAAGIAAFRALYEAEGIFRNQLYPGIADMLDLLRREGHAAWIVTSKPQPHAERVAALLDLDVLVDGIVGAGLAETDTKTALVARALAGSGAAAKATLMLGDRSYDVIGARENGVSPVGALWGYGSRAELWQAGCRRFATSADDFAHMFLRPLRLRAVG